MKRLGWDRYGLATKTDVELGYKSSAYRGDLEVLNRALVEEGLGSGNTAYYLEEVSIHPDMMARVMGSIKLAELYNRLKDNGEDVKVPKEWESRESMKWAMSLTAKDPKIGVVPFKDLRLQSEHLVKRLGDNLSEVLDQGEAKIDQRDNKISYADEGGVVGPDGQRYSIRQALETVVYNCRAEKLREAVDGVKDKVQKVGK